jgi:hypothetical protein
MSHNRFIHGHAKLLLMDVIFELFLTMKSKTKLFPIVLKQHDFVRIRNKSYIDVKIFNFVEICRRLPRADVDFSFFFQR